MADRSQADHDGSIVFFFFSSRRRHTRLQGDWSSDVCSSDLFGDAPTKDSWNAYALQACQLLQQETLLVQARSRAQLLWSLNLQDQAVVDRIGARLAAALVDGPDGLRARRMQAHDREHRVGIEHRVGRVGLYVEVLAHVCPPTSTLMPIPACRLHGQQRSEATPAPNQLVRRALFEDAAVLDHDDAIGLLRR